jgi:hypothetical protein
VTVLLNAIIMTRMLVVVPLGLRLVPGVPGWLPRAYLVGAGFGAGSPSGPGTRCSASPCVRCR